MGHGVATSGAHAPASERRKAARSLVRSLVVSGALIVAYFTLPMHHLGGGAVTVLLIGLVAITGLLVWEVRQILDSTFPLLRAVQALVLVATLFFVGFSTTYYAMSATEAATFNHPLTRLDAAYFMVTVFATVGFGDIVAQSETGRAVVLVQMVADLAVIGVVVRVFVRAVQVAQERKDASR